MMDQSEQLLRTPLNPKEPPLARSTIREEELSENPYQKMATTTSGFTSLSSLPNGATRNSYVQTILRWDAISLMRYLRYVNVILALMQALAGFLGLFDLVALDITSFLISVYAIIFALLLLAFECRFESMEPGIRRQFGFLFTFRGRTAFLYCVGFMDFGIDSSFGTLVGILMCLNATFNLLVMFFHPEFKNGHLSAQMDPTQAYTQAAEETAQLLAQNHHLTAKAGAYVLNHAQHNPELVTQVAQSVLANQGGYVPPPVRA